MLVDKCKQVCYLGFTDVNNGGEPMAHMSMTEAEWQVMERLWAQAPRTGRELCEELRAATGWSRAGP